MPWRRLPRGFSPEFAARELALWEKLHDRVDLARLGGIHFRQLAAAVGPVIAARTLQRVQNESYEKIRTLDDATLAELLAQLPPP